MIKLLKSKDKGKFLKKKNYRKKIIPSKEQQRTEICTNVHQNTYVKMLTVALFLVDTSWGKIRHQ